MVTGSKALQITCITYAVDFYLNQIQFLTIQKLEQMYSTCTVPTEINCKIKNVQQCFGSKRIDVLYSMHKLCKSFIKAI